MEGQGFSHPGLVRENNEDYFYLDADMGLIVVADGMGGHLAGEVASKLAVEIFVAEVSRRLNEPVADWQQVIAGAMMRANTEVFLRGSQQEGSNGMGTTLTSALVREHKVHLAHVGDSRAYLWRPGGIKLLTNDHSYVGEMVRYGSLTPEEARRHPQRNLLTHALGTEAEPAAEFPAYDWERGDGLLLCTDGLFSIISDSELTEILDLRLPVAETMEHLLQAVLSRGAPDNVTAVFARL